MSMRRPLGRVGSSAGGRVAARGEGSCQQEWLLTEQVAGAHRRPEREQPTRRSFPVKRPGEGRGALGV